MSPQFQILKKLAEIILLANIYNISAALYVKPGLMAFWIWDSLLYVTSFCGF